ncbi:MAG: ribosome assembly cofactor RimP [Crocinitomix sp.]|nr:ribosome assembly cofactor RimP [Crocinitomix sp.]
MIDKKTILKLAEERIEELNSGIYIVELKIASGNQIFLELDKEVGSIAIEDCMSVSRNIEHNLDREIEDFSLEVSSAGLDQPLRALKQFKKNIGREVKVVTSQNGQKFQGILKAADEEQISVEVKEKRNVEGRKSKVWITEELPFKYNDVKEVKLIISF